MLCFGGMFESLISGLIPGVVVMLMVAGLCKVNLILKLFIVKVVIR